MEWNLPTVIVLAVIALCVGAVLAVMIKNKKKGKSVGGCGCSCEGCTMNCSGKGK